MRTALLPAAAFIFLAHPASAQVTPGETPGDTGYVILGDDTLITVRGADGHAWLQQNLGAAEVATGLNGPLSYGDLYQWGRWTDGHQIRTSTVAQASVLPFNNPAGLGAGSPFFYVGADPEGWWGGGNLTDTWQGTSADANNGMDPCAMLGAGWELPSQADWEAIIAQEGISDGATALASNLHLPPAGSRDGQMGPLINVGQFGNYWSNTVNGPYAKNLTIGDVFVNPIDDALRSYGMSARCLHRSLHVGLPEPAHAARPSIFPNPGNGEFTVSCEAPILGIVVSDALGRVVVAIPMNALSADVSLGGLPMGAYVVEVRTEKLTYRERIQVVR